MQESYSTAGRGLSDFNCSGNHKQSTQRSKNNQNKESFELF